DDIIQSRLADKIVFSPADQQGVPALCIDGRSGRQQPIHGFGSVPEWTPRVAGGVLDRKPGNARVHCQADALEHFIGTQTETAFKVGIDGQVGGRPQIAQVSQGIRAGQLTIRSGLRPAISGAGGLLCLVPQTLQDACTAETPGGGEQKAAVTVHFSERSPLFVHCQPSHHSSVAWSPCGSDPLVGETRGFSQTNKKAGLRPPRIRQCLYSLVILVSLFI